MDCFLYETEVDKSVRLLTPGRAFFSSVLGSGAHDGRPWCAVSTVTQSSLPLPGEGDLFKILLQSSELRHCHRRPKAERDTKGNSDKATEPTSEKSLKNLNAYLWRYKGGCFQWSVLTEPVK